MKVLNSLIQLHLIYTSLTISIKWPSRTISKWGYKKFNLSVFKQFLSKKREKATPSKQQSNG